MSLDHIHIGLTAGVLILVAIIFMIELGIIDVELAKGSA